MAGNWQVIARVEQLTDSNHLPGLTAEQRAELYRYLIPSIKAAKLTFAFEWYHSLTNRQKTNSKKAGLEE